MASTVAPTRAYIAEFIGTFTLVFVGTAVAVLQGLNKWDVGANFIGIAFAFGGTLAVLVWTIGPVSGCHLNPAVSLPMALSGRLPMARLLGYMIAQFAGAATASAVLLFLLKGIPAYAASPEQGLGANGNPLNMDVSSLLGFEVLMTALFLLTIFTVTRKGAEAGFHGLAIGGFLFVAHLVGAQLGDSSLNPARSFGPAILEGGGATKILWVFIVGPLVGGLIGWRLFKLMHDE